MTTRWKISQRIVSLGFFYSHDSFLEFSRSISLVVHAELPLLPIWLHPNGHDYSENVQESTQIKKKLKNQIQ